MSVSLGQITLMPLMQNDDSIMANAFRIDGVFGLIYSGLLWPQSSLQGYDYTTDGVILQGTRYETDLLQLDQRGVKARRLITGRTKDSSDNPLGGVTVQAFQTSNDEFVHEVVSDAQGNYEIDTPYSTSHYLVAYLAGAPDVAGTTVNTLTGT